MTDSVTFDYDDGGRQGGVETPRLSRSLLRLAAEKLEQDRLAAEKLERERLAAEKLEQERLAAENTLVRI